MHGRVVLDANFNIISTTEKKSYNLVTQLKLKEIQALEYLESKNYRFRFSPIIYNLRCAISYLVTRQIYLMVSRKKPQGEVFTSTESDLLIYSFGAWIQRAICSNIIAWIWTLNSWYMALHDSHSYWMRMKDRQMNVS